MTAKEKLRERVEALSEEEAAEMLRIVEAPTKLEAWFEAESKLSDEQVRERDARWAEENARSLLTELDAEERAEFGGTISEAWGREPPA